MTVPKRLFSELLTGYQLNRKMRDIFVEGPTDKYLLSNLFQKDTPMGTSFRTADEIQIDVASLRVPGGARSRVLDVCLHAKSIGVDNIAGVIDRDYQALEERDRNSILFVTRFASLDFHIAALERLFEIIGLAMIATLSEQEKRKIISVCLILFRIRVIATAKGVPCGIPDISRILDFRKNNLSEVLPLENLAARMDSKNGTKGAWRSIIFEHREALYGLTEDRPELAVRFHDFEEVAGIFLTRCKNVSRDYVGLDWLGKLVRSQVSSDFVLDEFLTRLLRWIREDESAQTSKIEAAPPIT